MRFETMSNVQSTHARLPRSLMLGISFAQGIALFLLWRALDNQAWPSLTPALNFPLWTLVLVWPTLLLLSVETGNLARSLKAISLFSGVLVLLAVYMGWQATPHGEFPIESLLAICFITALIACFKGLMFCQQWIGQVQRTYADLFARSWRNFLVVALATVMTLGVALILLLWGTLFYLIGIDFFRDLFREEWFLMPVLTVAFGLGVQIFRRLVHVIDSITSLLEGLMRLLLPLVASVVVIFLGALPFTGLAPLWETGTGTALLLWLNAFTLFFINAVYQTGRALPYPPLVHNLLSPAIALLPVVSALALYGLYLRIDDYGLTVARCWALAVFLVLALFSAGYSWCIARNRSAWPQRLGQVNTAMGWVLLALTLLVNSPALDFRKISLASQLQRVEAGEIELRDFDFHYATHELARPGYLRMQAILDEIGDSDAELARIIREPVPRTPDGYGVDRMWEQMVYRPEPFQPPPGLRNAIGRSSLGPPEWRGAGFLFQVDLDADGDPEYVLAVTDHDGRQVRSWRFSRENSAWQAQRLYLRLDLLEEEQRENLAAILGNGKIEPVPDRFRNLQVGELLFHEDR